MDLSFCCRTPSPSSPHGSDPRPPRRSPHAAPGGFCVPAPEKPCPRRIFPDTEQAFDTASAMYYDSSGKCQSRRLPDSSHKGGMIHETARFPQTFGCRSPDRGCRSLRRCPCGQRFFHTGGSSGVQPGRTRQLRRPRRGSQPDHQRGGRHPAGGAGAPDPGRRGSRRLFYPGDQRGGAGAGLRGPGLDAVGPGGGQAVHRGAPRLQLPAARTGGRPGPPAGRHHRGVQHRLRRRAQLHPGALPGGAGARLYRHRRRPDPGRERLDDPAGGGRRAAAGKLRGRSLCRLR